MKIANTRQLMHLATTLLLLLTLCSSRQLLASELHASISSDTIGITDPVTLTLTVSGAPDSHKPDLTSLRKDFEILGTTMSSQSTNINGVNNQSMSWMITLMPRSTGSLTIPKVQLGSESSQAMTIDVVDASQLPQNKALGDALTIDIVMDEKSHYIHEQIPLTLRIIDAVGISNASIQAPSGSGYELEQTGTDRIQTTTQNGKQVNSIERTYLLKPQHSGALEIPPFVLQATIPDATPPAVRNFASGFANRSLFNDFGSGPGASMFERLFNSSPPIRISSAPLSLDIKARPNDGHGWFLPARHVELQSHWLNESPELKVGEAATRIVRLIALGASPEQLPALQFNNSVGIKQYLEKSADRTIDTEQGKAAMREYRVSMVPTQPGQITLPEMNVTWWNTDTDKSQTARLPAEILNVKPAPGGFALSGDNSTEAISVNAQNLSTNSDSTLPSVSRANVYAVVVLAIVLGAAISLYAMYQRKGAIRPVIFSSKNPPSPKGTRIALQRWQDTAASHADLKQLHQKLVHACRQNDDRGAYTALIDWCAACDATAAQTNGTTLRKLLSSDMDFSDRVSQLETRLYNEDASAKWEGPEFLKTFRVCARRWKKLISTSSSIVALPKLYPSYEVA